MKQCFLLLVSLLFFSIAGFTQDVNAYKAEYDTITKKIVNDIQVPKELQQQCKSFTVSFILSYTNGIREREIIFSKNFPSALKEEFVSKVKVFDAVKWRNIFPGATRSKNFSILIPIIYYFDDSCREKMTSDIFAETVSAGLSFDKTLTTAIYLLKPLSVSLVSWPGKTLQ
ncbi:hypothetical protein [Chitinophaga sp. OAE865]|uniref:hypothetical protein n=1 Tax=Chitinophaga sp. OAE865 TaxID=2817898 RepID=UPI001AE8B193